MLFIGHTRFSLFNPKSSSWRATNGRFTTPEEYRDYLFADDRLDVRCDIFVDQSLPQLELAAKEHKLLHVVSYSDSLPEKHKARLVSAAQRFDFLVLDEHSNRRLPTDLERLARGYFDGKAGVYGTYRLDDDDLLTSDYFDQMATFLRPENAGMLVSLASGFTALYNHGRYSNFREAYWPMLAIGLLSICHIDADGHLTAPDHAPHNLADRSNPVIVDARKPAYLWVRHLDQDTAMDFSPAEARSRMLQQMARYPLAEAPNISGLFPALNDRYRDPAREPIAHGSFPLTGHLSFEFAQPAFGNFSIAVTAEWSLDVASNNALVSLDLVTEDGLPVPEATTVAGAAKSANETVGFYRYLLTPPGRSENTYDFSLPAGVMCQGITFRKWKRQESGGSLSAIDLIHV